MARTVTWERGIAQTVGSSSGDYVTAPLLNPAGATLVRLHYQILFQDWGELTFDNRPFGTLTYGVIVDDAVEHTPPPDPTTTPNAPWLWYESVYFRHWSSNLGEYDVHEGPLDGGIRDVKAQRVLDNENAVLQFVFKSIASGISTPIPYMDVGYQAAILLPHAV